MVQHVGHFGYKSISPHPEGSRRALLFAFNSSWVSFVADCHSASLIQDINELSRQEVDEIINATMRHDCISSYDKIWKRVEDDGR
ncbi:uncharacterized protein LOC120111531 isoform X2 [Phoenix dactylifera]|uniref:Uncharacterized protein LOC120111531 isoform X2 n=1 Tax=Phoenix dactylifera TaxID=42345 RepID=A0A8B9AE10_PHODC|nr:uncharacterized protein LOC120111531 isoform X2 [Phoenix dactylifera]